GAAVLRAEKMIDSRPRRLEPRARIATGQHIAVQTKGWDKEAVNHILGNEHEPDRSASGNVQRADLALALGMLKLPHPLLGDNVDRRGLGRRAKRRAIDDTSPGKDE